MANKPVALVLGSGPRIGQAVAQKLAGSGYAVAVASRKGTGSRDENSFFAVQADLSQPTSVPSVFAAVKKELGAAPSLVVYNAAALTPPPEAKTVFTIPAENVVADLNINTVSAFVAAQQAVEGWATLGSDEKSQKVFVYTGNILNTTVLPVPLMTTLGMGKSASAYWIGTADGVYADKGYRFFYADERYADGSLKGQNIDGDAHADFYAHLATAPKDVPWHATFAKDQGYTKF